MPASDEIDVWVVPLPIDDPTTEGAAIGILSVHEQRRAQRLTAPAARARFVHGRAALRQIAGAYLRVPPRRVDLVEDPNGKPRLRADPARLELSLSHTRDLAAIAVATRPVGIDIEALDRKVDVATMRRALLDDEFELVLAQPPDQRAEAFLRHWTVKEAYVKALGTGLALLGLRSIAVANALDAPSLPGAGAWSAQRLDPADGFVGAVVAANGPWVARRRESPSIIAARK